MTNLVKGIFLMGQRSKTKRKHRGKAIFKVIALLLTLITIALGIYATTLYFNAKKLINEEMHHPVEAIDTTLTKKKLSEVRKINVLLLGIDAEEDQIGRSDAIMVMQLIPESDEMTIVSIPRDTRTKIVGRDKEDKINHAFAYGVNECGVPCGANMAVATVENLLNIDIDYYISINMDGLVELVDELGTITVDKDRKSTRLNSS